MPLLRIVRWSLLGIGVLLLVAAAWVGWQAWQVSNDLDDVVDHADAFRAAVETGDQRQADRELASLRRSSHAASSRTDGWSWSMLTHLPVFGDDAEGVRVASEVIDDLARDGLDPLMRAREQMDGLVPQDGVLPIDAIRDLQGPVADAEAALDAADRGLAAEDPSGFSGRLRDKYTELQDKIGDARDAMASARTATEVLPAMLGERGGRQYLLVFQNNAEIRATGGLPGAVALLRSRHGDLQLGRQAAGSDFGRAPTLPLPLTQAERALYDDVVGSYFLSSNMTPDLPRAAALWAARWAQVYPKDHIDGVITLDTVAIGYLLDATGPITVDGVVLTGSNVVDQLLHDVYLTIDDPKKQDAFFAHVAAAAFDRFANGAGNPIDLVKALARGTDEGRIAVASFDPTVESELAGTEIASEFVTDPAVRAPQIDVTVNDTTGAKMSYYLRYEVDVKATYCVDAVQGFTASAALTSLAPKDAAHLPPYVTGGGDLGTKPGHQLVTVRIFGPVDGQVADLTLNNKPLDPLKVDQSGRPVRMFYLELKPGQTYDLAWTMRSGRGQTDDPHVRVTPGIDSRGNTTKGAC